MFGLTWRNKFLTIHAKSIPEMAAALRNAATQLEEMAEAGVTLGGGQEDDYAHLTTSDSRVAKRFGMKKDDWHEHGGEG